MVRRMWRKVSSYPARLYNAEHWAADALALERLAPLRGSPLPWTQYSMRPTAIEATVSDIILNRRRSIVECGSGNSTIYTARLLAHLGEGHLVTVEHDADWVAFTAGLLEREGLSEWVTVAHAPLVGGWYDRAAIPAVERIDLLVVDGPPANTPQLANARFPALPHFVSALADGASILVDDVDRPGERAVVDRWTREFDTTIATLDHSYALLRR